MNESAKDKEINLSLSCPVAIITSSIKNISFMILYENIIKLKKIFFLEEKNKYQIKY